METAEQAASECGNAMCEKYGMTIDHAIPCEEAFLMGFEFGRKCEIEEVDTVQMKTVPIGERFQDGDVTLEVKKAVCGCDGCFYKGVCPFLDDIRELAGECAWHLRSDRTLVIFEKVEP